MKSSTILILAIYFGFALIELWRTWHGAPPLSTQSCTLSELCMPRRGNVEVLVRCAGGAHRSMALADETSLVVMLLSNRPVTDSSICVYTSCLCIVL